MMLRSIVPALAILAPTLLSGVEVTDGKATLKIGVRLQPRIEIASASDAKGDDYDIWEGKAYPDNQDDAPQTVNFLIRRARLYFSGDYKQNTKFNLCLDHDKLGTIDGGQDAGVNLKYASVSQVFNLDEGMSFEIQVGKELADFVAGTADSSGKLLLPTARITDLAKTDVQGGETLGLFLKFKSKVFKASVNLTELEKDKTNNDDWALSARVATPLLPDLAIEKRMESYCGKKSDGLKHEAGLGVGTTIDSGIETGTTTVVTADYLLWWDSLTANFDFGYRMFSPAKGDDINGMAIGLQGGYAIPVESVSKDFVIEPALRLALVDADIDEDEEKTVYKGEGGASGTYLDVGVNFYYAGHSNKTQVALTSFAPEDGDGNAIIFRIQHQLDF